MAIYQPESFYETSLASAITVTDSSISVTTAPNITAGYLVIEANTSNREIILYTGVTGTTLTGCVRGLATFGSDISAGTGKAHAAGVQVANKDVHYYYAQYYDFLVGTSATGSNGMRIGDGAAVSSSDRFWYVNTSSVSAFWGLSSNGIMVVSEDGVTSYSISAGGSGLGAGTGIEITAGSIYVASLSTGAIASSASKLVVEVSAGIDRNAGGVYVDQNYDFAWTNNQSFAAAISTASVKVSSYDVALELFNGSNADSLHAHKHPLSFSTFFETIDRFSSYTTAHTFGISGLRMDGNPASSDYTTQTFVGVSAYPVFGNGNTVDFSFMGTPRSNANNMDVNYYVIIGDMGASYVAPTLTNNHLGFQFYMPNCVLTSISATAADGTTKMATSLSSTSLATHLYRVVYDGTDAKFYIDDSLINTITINLPNTSALGNQLITLVEHRLTGDGGGTPILYVHNANYQQYLN